jgi:hypothetical protein
LETKIVKRAIITVDRTEHDTYGNLIVYDKDGQKYKISPKREPLFNLFTPGATIELGYGEYEHKQYIAGAVVAKGQPEKAVDKVVAPDTGKGAESPRSAPQTVEKGKSSSFALSYAKDLVVGYASTHEIELDASVTKVIEIACIFDQYLQGNLQIDNLKLTKLIASLK